MLVKFWEFLDRPPPLNPVQASYFAKVIGMFLIKKTSEMLQFIKSQPEVVPKLLLHMSTSAIMDLLLKIISMEESPDGKGTVQWLSEQGLMPWLVNRLDPNFDAEVHSIASQVLLDIIAISQSSHPEQPSIGTNILIDELKSEVLVSQLVGFMLDRDAPYSSSTLINGVTIFIELIRRNNSDYDVEPLPPNSTETVREAVDLSDLLKVLASRIEDFKNLLIVPRSVTGPIDTSIGKQTPLGFERLKICEMFAELLHCSNMAVLNSRPIITVSPDGTVEIPSVSTSGDYAHDVFHQAKENANGKTLESDDELMEEGGANGTKKDETMSKTDHAADLHNGHVPTGSTSDDLATPRASPALRPTTSTLASAIVASLAPSTQVQGDVLIPVGDFLKLQFVDHRIIPTCFDLFFQFPWNNFLHTVVYDMVHQVFHRPMGDIGRPDVDGTYIPPGSDHDITEGWNRRLTISIFKDGQLTKRITDAQRLNDYECAQPKGVRLGYMGHLTYIADETVKLLESYAQTSLLSTLYGFVDLEDWWNYVYKILKETKERDAQVLGGTRPNVNESQKADIDDGNDDDYIDDNDEEYGSGNDFVGGGGTGHEGDVATDQFARYLCQQIASNLPDKFGSSDEDEDDDESNWVGEYGAENEFDMRRTGAGESGPFEGGHAMDFDSDDEEAVDEEPWNAPQWPGVNIPESKPAEQGPVSQSEVTLTGRSDKSQDGFSDLKTATPSGEEGGKSAADGHKQDSGDLTSTTAAPEQASNTSTSANPTDATTQIPLHTPKHIETDEIIVNVPATLSLDSAVQESAADEASKGKDVVIEGGHSTNSISVVLEPVTLAPEETPDMSMSFAPSSASSTASDNSSTQSISSTTVEPPSTPASSLSSTSSLPSSTLEQQLAATMDMDVIPLADPVESKHQATTGMESISQDQLQPMTADSYTAGAKDDKKIAEAVEDLRKLELEKQG
ncbi:hypothetical protein BGZ58_008837 [Dissophora ornata]|nr:hypothetical protein BGZ58_008837 [Dissophora ornata]